MAIWRMRHEAQGYYINITIGSHAPYKRQDAGAEVRGKLRVEVFVIWRDRQLRARACFTPALAQSSLSELGRATSRSNAITLIIFGGSY